MPQGGRSESNRRLDGELKDEETAPVNFQLMLFGALAGIAAITAIGVVACRDAVRSALCLVGNFFTLAFLYFTLNAEILGATQIVVYTGAIMVLFLFVIMLLNVKTEEPTSKLLLGFGVIAAGSFALALTKALSGLHPSSEAGAGAVGTVRALGLELFRNYVFPFEVASLLIIAAIVGAVMLSQKVKQGVAGK